MVKRKKIEVASVSVLQFVWWQQDLLGSVGPLFILKAALCYYLQSKSSTVGSSHQLKTSRFPSETSSSRCVTWHSSSWITPPAACFLMRCVQLLFLWVGLWDKLLLTLITALKKETLHADNTRGRLMTRSTPQEAAAASDPAVLIKDLLPDISLWSAWNTASDASIFIF